MRLQSAIFDMDGTLLDSMPIWRDLGTSVLRGLGIEPEPETDEMLKTLSLRHGIALLQGALPPPPDGGGADRPGSGPGRGFLSA